MTLSYGIAIAVTSSLVLSDKSVCSDLYKSSASSDDLLLLLDVFVGPSCRVWGRGRGRGEGGRGREEHNNIPSQDCLVVPTKKFPYN